MLIIKYLSKYHLFAISWGIFTTIVSLIPSDNIPLPKKWNEWDLDNFVHAFIFAVLTFLLIKGFKDSVKKNYFKKYDSLISIVISIIYGIILELIQIGIPGRGFEFTDIISNSIGSLAGFGFFYLFYKP